MRVSDLLSIAFAFQQQSQQQQTLLSSPTTMFAGSTRLFVSKTSRRIPAAFLFNSATAATGRQTSSRLHLPTSTILFAEMSSSPSGGASSSDRKAGVIDPTELKEFIDKAGDKLFVADVRNPDADVEPGDVKSIAVGPLPADGVRPAAQLLTYSRATNSMPLPDIPKDTPIITHCGAGGRGQKAKEFLEANGFTNVVNGGGPKDTENWDLFGSK